MDEILRTVNEMLCSDNDENMFVTAFVAILDVSTGRLNYANAGHNLPLICKNNEEYQRLNCKRSFVLGGLENIKYSADELTMSSGDHLFVYTDGVTEAMNDSGKLYSDDRLRKVLNDNRTIGEEQLIRAVHADISEHAGNTAQSDDITMISLKYLGGLN